MAKLFIFMPFNKAQLQQQQDLPPQAMDFYNTFQTVTNKRIGDNIGAEISSVEVVYADSAFTVTDKDYIIVFAHGGKDSNDLSSNIPQVFVSEKVVMDRLSQKKAYNAQKILFMCCYSALNDHIAQAWKKNYRGQTVYGGDSAISNLFSATRTQIKTCCLALFEVK